MIIHELGSCEGYVPQPFDTNKQHGIDTFLEGLTNLADRVFQFDEGPRDSPKLTVYNKWDVGSIHWVTNISLWPC